jgi:hypothetical protein
MSKAFYNNCFWKHISFDLIFGTQDHLDNNMELRADFSNNITV